MLNDMWRDLINASESDYISENYLIEIIPNSYIMLKKNKNNL